MAQILQAVAYDVNIVINYQETVMFLMSELDKADWRIGVLVGS